MIFGLKGVTGVNVEDLTVSVTKNSDPVVFSEAINGTSRSIIIKGIYPQNLTDVYTISVSDGSGNSRTINYSAMSYIYRKSGTDDMALDAVCRALQYYFVKAVAYTESIAA